MTDAEKLLWSKIRRKQLKGFQFYRQKIIGNYIADFHCPEITGMNPRASPGPDSAASGGEFYPKRDVLKNLNAVLEEIWKRL